MARPTKAKQDIRKRGIQLKEYAIQTDVEKQREQNIVEWTTVFRRNWHIYAEYVLGIKLKPFQRVMMWLAGQSDVFFAIMSRGCSKSFLAGLMAVCKIMLYPYAEVVITSSTVDQANKLFTTKIRDELIKKLSPYLRDCLDRGYLVINNDDDGYRMTNNLNGAWLKVLPCLDSARGNRACLLIYEECRLLKKTMIDSVFEPMAHPRQAQYLLYEGSPYAHNNRWLEECKSIYITSNRYSYEWFWRLFQTCVTEHYLNRKTVYNVFAGDIFMSIENGLKTWGDLRKSQKNMSKFDYEAEILNQVIGEAEDAFFNIKEFTENQIIEQCWRPPTISDLYLGRDIGNPPKKPTEIRLIVADFAFANTISQNDNDNTFIMCMSLHWDRNHFERHVDYAETHEAGDSLGAANRIRALRYDYDADYIVLDLRNGGETLFNYMSEPKDDAERGRAWEYHGLGLADSFQQVTQEKQDDLRHRTIDPKAIKCLIPVTATGESNTRMWLELKKQLQMNNIKFPIPLQRAEEQLMDTGAYYDMTTEQLATAIMPNAQIDALMQEAVNLSAEYRQDKLKLTEPKNGTKDRIVCLSYVNWIATTIENKWAKDAQEEEFDISDWRLVF